MALDINGYNSVFKQFVTFAQQNRNVDKGRAILDAKIESPLNGRKILSIDLATNDSASTTGRAGATSGPSTTARAPSSRPPSPTCSAASRRSPTPSGRR